MKPKNSKPVKSKKPGVQLTSRAVIAGFDVTSMCLHNWLKGSPQRKPLPFTKAGSGATSPRIFSAEEMQQWAAEHSLNFDLKKAMKALQKS